jgi:hypothetical protein
MTIRTKHPIQIYLEKSQEQALRRLASKKHVALAALIREGVDLLLAQSPLEDDPAWHIIGIGNSNIADLGTAHDEYLVQELEKENKE